MNAEHHDESERESRLNEILLEYLEEAQQGRAPERRRLLSRHPEFAAELREFLSLRDEIGRLAAPLREASLSAAATEENAASVPAETEKVALSPPDAAAPSAASSELGQIGEFRLLREIGRGGMGVVYEAYQTSLNRRIALKVLPFASAFDPKQLKRFENEAQAAAQLHHTNIVPVFAVGHERGVHYYAMQLIDGQSLADLIDELSRHEPSAPWRPAVSRDKAPPGDTPVAAEQPSNLEPLSLSRCDGGPETPALHHASFTTERSTRRMSFFRRVAQLMQKAAEALEHAHQAGVVHRDIKPANLLLDVRGNLWITDFGLALFQSTTGLTMTGELLGTLRYMSPEQVSAKRNEVDHRTDIYSLGVTLYELLTLRPAFDGQDRNELLTQIALDDPPAPRRFDRVIPVELETIVLKAIAKEPAERYATAQQMAEDLQRFLDDKPILARRPSAIDRARKWMRRHPALVGSALLLLVCGVIGFGVSTALIARAYDEERRQRKEAEERFQLARQAADEMISIADDELADNPFTGDLRKRMLQGALAYYQKFIEQRRDDPDAQAVLKITRDRVKKIIDDLVLLQGDRQIFLLKDPQVLDDLNASLEQRDHIARLTKQLDDHRDEPFRDFHRRTTDENDRRCLEKARANETAVAGILMPEQLTRLRQLAVQSRGTTAFHESEIATQLKLTLEQRARIREIEEEVYFSGKFGRPEPGSENFWKGHTFRVKTATERILAILTPDQARRWHTMTGEPFNGTFRYPPPFGGGPKGPPPNDDFGDGRPH